MGNDRHEEGQHRGPEEQQNEIVDALLRSKTKREEEKEEFGYGVARET